MVRSRKLAFSLTTDRSKCVSTPGYISCLVISKIYFFLCFLFFFSSPSSGTTCSCIAHFSTRHIVAHRPVNAAAALVPRGAYRSLSRRFRRHQVIARMTLAYGPWTSCKSARWEVGHRMGRTCESRVVIFDQGRDVPMGAVGPREERKILYSWTIQRTIQNLLSCPTAACRNWGSRSQIYLTSLSSPIYQWLFCLAAPLGILKLFRYFAI
jgi:hypothetical protein